jgi:hypothetical protein
VDKKARDEDVILVMDTREKDRGTKAIHRSIADASTAKKTCLIDMGLVSFLTQETNFGWEERKEI